MNLLSYLHPIEKASGRVLENQGTFVLIKICGRGRQTLDDFACAVFNLLGLLKAMAFSGRMVKIPLGCGGPVP